jgi:hypothetical protein
VKNIETTIKYRDILEFISKFQVKYFFIAKKATSEPETRIITHSVNAANHSIFE